jgi:uncharacterized protein (DUF4415 family)
MSRAKPQVTMRVDPDAPAFYRATASGWQTRIHRALREAMGAG